MKVISIIGSGPVGSSLAILLARAGYKVNLFEKRSDVGQASEGFPSISLLISPRGQKMVKDLGLWGAFLEKAFPLTGRFRHLPTGDSVFMPYGKKDWINYAVDRNALANIIFTEAKNTPNISLYSNHQLVSMTQDVLRFDVNGEIKTFEKGDLLVGADGANSRVRDLMKEFDSLIQIHKEKFSHRYTQVSLGMDHMPKQALRAINIWPRKDHCIVGMPNSKESLKCTLILPKDVTESSESVIKFIQESFPQIYENLKIENDLKSLRFADLNIVEMNSYYDAKSNTILIGDAAHTILPFMGQGVNLGLEDVGVLYEYVIANKDLHEFSNERVKQGLSASVLSAEHYVTIIKSSYQKPPTIWNKMSGFVKGLFKNETPIAVIRLDFEGVPHSSLVDENKLRFR